MNEVIATPSTLTPSTVETKQEAAYVTLKVEGKDIKFKLDTGAQVNILPLSVFRSTQMNKYHKVRRTTQR